MKPATVQKRIEGVLSPVITPFKRDLSPDADRFVKHCRWLMKSGCAGLAVFGTNSEANSMSVEEKLELLDALVKGGVPAAALMPGTGHCALTDSVKMTREAVRMGCGGVLMLPPFYYKGVSDEGLFRNFSEVIERVGDERLRLYLYHIPPVSNVGITLELIERLLTRYPGIVAGAKDSSGDWNNTKAMLDRFKDRGFDVFPGSEVFLLDGLRAGGKGCITATGNVNPGADQRGVQELARHGCRQAAGRHHRDAQDRAEGADDPGAEGRSPRTSATTRSGAPCARRSPSSRPSRKSRSSPS